MDKPKIKMTSISLGGLHYHEPVINEHDYLSQSYNVDLLAKRPSTLHQIQEELAAAEVYVANARCSPEIPESRYHYYCALKRFDEAGKALIVLITHKYHLHRSSELAVLHSLPVDPEFLLMEQIQRRRIGIIAKIIEHVLCLIEGYILVQSWHLTDCLFDEINRLGLPPELEQRICALKERVAKGKLEYCLGLIDDVISLK